MRLILMFALTVLCGAVLAHSSPAAAQSYGTGTTPMPLPPPPPPPPCLPGSTCGGPLTPTPTPQPAPSPR